MKRKTKAKNLISIENYAAALLCETLEEIEASQIEVARATGIPAPHLTEMKKGRRRITPEVDLRLSRYFGLTPGYFAVFFPTDAHCPQIHNERDRGVYKAVVKIDTSLL